MIVRDSGVCEMSAAQLVRHQDLYEIVITITRIAVQRSTRLYRVCNVTWRAQLCSLPRRGLLQKLRYLINHLDLRTIVKCFNRGLFADDPDILYIGYNEIVRRGVRDSLYVEAVVKKYENLQGKEEISFHNIQELKNGIIVIKKAQCDILIWNLSLKLFHYIIII
ncbi:uncharacterized protein LOC112465705 [Temnothorax curvispinosus]|uniref:Uncharacterized protein LOC112465705 n=1 Tax=Temnothorax curvispinosus TaxID=300111 RepID=A0A6J1R2H3_9HYME|nr:uncharacterized protein LOC112465705 [Temnothorax curvispinosus]